MLGNLPDLIEAVGLLGIVGIIFAETGLFVGFFLPGDSLLFTAGFLASQGVFSLPVLLGGTVLAAIIGDSTGYWIGRRVGTSLYQRPDSRFFKRAHLQKAQAFYAAHGPKTVILARFIPIVRTFGPVVAGISRMPYPTYLSFSILGGLLWAGLLPLAGYYLGSLIPDVDRYLLPIILAIVIISLLPALKELWPAIRRKGLL